MLDLPDWAAEHVESPPAFADDESRVRFVIGLAYQNVVRGTGGPFAAAVVERAAGQVVSVGVNSVERLRCSVAHAEVIALALAQARVGAYSLRAPGLAAHELVTTCQPCAMCLGAVGWSGVDRLVCAADRADAVAVGFDEGVLPTAWEERFAEAGIEVVRGVLHDEARAVMDHYVALGGSIYNA